MHKVSNFFRVSPQYRLEIININSTENAEYIHQIHLKFIKEPVSDGEKNFRCRLISADQLGKKCPVSGALDKYTRKVPSDKELGVRARNERNDSELYQRAT